MRIEDLQRAISKYKQQDNNILLYLKGEFVSVKSDEVILKLLEEYK